MEVIYEYLLRESGIRYRDTVAIGVSGGPDSMALLDLIIRLKSELDLIVIVCHVNHNIREESKEEEAYLRSFCKEQGLHFEGMKIENYGDDNFHNEARTIRYNFFDKVCKEHSARFLMTAHHGDDLIETVLMRIVRGSTLKGYSGFSKVIVKDDYTILRPLISVTKKELEDYCETKKIKYFIDKSNLKDTYTRNRYRKYILPFLKEEDPLVHEKFLKFSETLIMYNNYIDNEMNLVINKVFKGGILSIPKFQELDHLIQTKIIYSILEKIYGDDLLIITNTHVKLIFDLIEGEKVQSMVHLPNNVKIIKTYSEISFGFDDEISDKYEIEISGVVNLPNGKNIDVVNMSDDTSNFVSRFSFSDVTLPLYVRTRRNGDKMSVKGMDGHKKVNDIFIDNKISNKDRQVWPIVCDAKDNIIWVPGLKKSKFDKENQEEYDIILKYY
jgi:tRNA(Ile)-lysidine synthase